MSKKTKAAKKAKKAAEKINALKCPKCAHTVGDHRRSYGMYALFMMSESSGTSGCHGKNESRDEKGFIRLQNCECDLKPEEAAVNAERGIKSAPLDANALLRNLK